MTDHIRHFDRAHATRWNTLHCSSEARNILNRNVQLEGVFLHSDVNQGTELLDDAVLDFIYGRKYGLVGRNGVGKSTLLRAMAEHQIMGIYDHQRILLVDDGTDALVMDDVDGTNNTTVLEYLLAQHKDRIALHQQLVGLVEGAKDTSDENGGAVFDTAAYERLMDELQHLNDASTNARAMEVLHGLGINPDSAMRALSGGWRHRVTLATALFLEADVLLLDEPTNHLDLAAIVWLEAFLKSTPSTVVVVSHDFHFLDAVVSNIVAFESKKLRYYAGHNFSDYVAAKQKIVQQQKRMYLAQEKRRRHLTETIEKLQSRAQGSATGKGFGAIRSRQQQLKHRLGAALDGTYWKYSLMGPRPEILAPADEEPYDFVFETDVSDVPEGAGGGDTTLLEAEDIGFSFHGTNDKGDCEVFKHVSLSLSLTSRLGLVGENGTGKSTLLRLLCGVDGMQPTEGTMQRWCGLRTALFAQHIVKELRDEMDALHWLQRTSATSHSLEELRNALGRMGLTGKMAEETPLKHMSDGQRARVVFASILMDKPHIIFLDEPTSHLDAETCSAVAAALVAFEGGIVVASHDRSFLEEVTTSRFCLDPWLFGDLTMSLDQYRDEVLRHNGQPNHATSSVASRAPAAAPSATAMFKQQEVTSSERSALAGSHVTCRHCQGQHFTHACPNRQAPAQGVSFEQTVEARRAAVLAHMGEGGATANKKAPLPPTREKAKDNEGDWHVAVSKSTKKRLEQQLHR